VDLAIEAGDDGALLALVPRLMAVRTPDLVLPAGTPVDLGGDAEARAAWVGALWRAGQHADAIAAARALLATRELPEVRARVGMAPAEAAPPALEVVRPPAPDAALRLRDGRSFDLAEQRGEVVLFAFWATWCRPCLEELPALDRMAAARPGLRVVAVSVDQGPDAVAKVDAMVAQLGLALPVAHDPALGRAYGVEALPSVRLVGRGGAVVHAARGHSAAGLARLEAAIDGALAAPASARAAVGSLRGQGTLELQAWAALAGVGRVAAAPDGAVVSVAGAAPVRFAGGDVELDVSGGGGGGPIAWSGGPVSGPERGHWLRARDPDGAARWLRTLPSGLVAVAASGPHLFVGLEDELLLLDAAGTVLARREGRVSGLAPDGQGGVWVAGPDTRLHVRPGAEGGLVVSEVVVPDIRRVGPGGSTGAGRVRHVVSGPFGPGGAERFVVSTADGRVIGLDGQGTPALVAHLPDEVSLSVVQAGEQGAALALALPGLGVGLATLALP
jgi:thiol-disulfide isomerase/thioredoxin